MDDRLAIQKCRGGDKDAFRHLVERYQAQAISHGIAILGNREDALDAVQDAFLDAFQAVGRFDLTRRFYPWFYVILRNCCYKQTGRRRKQEVNDLGETEILAPAPGLSTEELITLERALLELAVEDRELLTLKHLDGLSYQELAERLEIPPGTVMSRLYHARRRLRDKLARHYFTGLAKGRL